MWAVVIGGTGQVGRQVLSLLCKNPHYTRVVSITRRPLSSLPNHTALFPTPNTIEEHVLDDICAFDLSTLGHAQDDPVHIFCCFGSTRGQAGGGEAFERLEKSVIGGYIHKAREWFTPSGPAKGAGNVEASEAKRKRLFALVSSTGADAESRWVLYARVKGELEQMAIAELAGIAGVRIFRPAFLWCEREEGRLGEALAKPFVSIARFLAPTKVDIATADLAKAMLADAKLYSTGAVTDPVVIRSNAECQLLAADYVQ